MGTATHTPIADGRKCGEFGYELAMFIEEFIRLIALHPGFKNLQMFWILTHGCKRNLVRSEGAFNRNSIHFLRTGPSLGRAQNDHGPDGLLRESAVASCLLNRANLRVAI